MNHIRYLTQLFNVQLHATVTFPFVEVKSQFLRFICFWVEGLANVRVVVGLDLAGVGTVVVHIWRPGVLLSFVKRDFYSYNILSFVIVVLDPTSLVMIIDEAFL